MKNGEKFIFFIKTDSNQSNVENFVLSFFSNLFIQIILVHFFRTICAIFYYFFKFQIKIYLHFCLFPVRLPHQCWPHPFKTLSKSAALKHPFLFRLLAQFVKIVLVAEFIEFIEAKLKMNFFFAKWPNQACNTIWSLLLYRIYSWFFRFF